MPALAPDHLLTDRLRLRRWRDTDREPFARMCADEQVMRYFPAVLDRTRSDAFIDRACASFARVGFGLWALERQDGGQFIGFTGLAPMHPGSPGAGGIEVGWRLVPSAWGQGLATEAARAALVDGFSRLEVSRIWSWTAQINAPSQAVMRRLGMTEHSRLAHPDLPTDSPLSVHVAYVMDRDNAPQP